MEEIQETLDIQDFLTALDSNNIKYKFFFLPNGTNMLNFNGIDMTFKVCLDYNDDYIIYLIEKNRNVENPFKCIVDLKNNNAINELKDQLRNYNKEFILRTIYPECLLKPTLKGFDKFGNYLSKINLQEYDVTMVNVNKKGATYDLEILINDDFDFHVYVDYIKKLVYSNINIKIPPFHLMDVREQKNYLEYHPLIKEIFNKVQRKVDKWYELITFE